jgi:hypothetical protein
VSDVAIIIAGSRGLQVSPTRIHTELTDEYDGDNVWQIVSGGEPTGVDRCGEIYAKLHNKAVRIFPADWNRHGKGAGPVRNRQMAEYADGALVFLGDTPTPGSSNMIAWMHWFDKPVRVVRL